MAISETISVDAGPAIGALNDLAVAAEGAAGKFAAAVEKMSKAMEGLSGGGGKGPGGLAAQWNKAATDITAAIDKVAKAQETLGKASALASGAGPGEFAKQWAKAAADVSVSVSKIAEDIKKLDTVTAETSTAAADSIKGIGKSAAATGRQLNVAGKRATGYATAMRESAAVSADAAGVMAASQKTLTEQTVQSTQRRSTAHKTALAADASGYVKFGKAAGLVSVLVAGYGVDLAAKLQTSVTKLYSTAGESKANLPLMTQGILALSGQTATSQAELGAGAYMIESAGFHGTKALSILKAAAQGAKAEGTPLGDVANALTSLMVSYKGQPGAPASPTAAMNAIIAMVGAGKMTMQGAVTALPQVLPAGAKAGLSFGEVGGALATMTRTGMSPEQSAENLRHAIGTLQNPSSVQRLEMEQLGISSVKLSKNLGSAGLTGTISTVEHAILHNMGPAGTVMLKSLNASRLAAQSATTEIKAMPAPIAKMAQAYLDGAIGQKDFKAEYRAVPGLMGNLLKQFEGTADAAHGFNNQLKAGGGNAQVFAAALSKAMGGTVGMQVALMLGGASAGDFKQITQDVTAGAKNAGENIRGWSDIQKTFNFQLAAFKYNAQAAATAVGTALLPAATGAMKALSGVGGFLAGHKTLAVDLTIAGGLAGVAAIGTKLASPLQSALKGVGAVGKILQIPGLDKLANIGKQAGLDSAAASLTGAGGSLDAAAGSLEGAAASLRGAAVTGGVSGAGTAAAGAAGTGAAAGGAAAEGEAAAAGASAGKLRGTAATAGLGVLAAATIVDPLLKSMKNSQGNWLDNAFATPKTSGWNSWSSLGHDIATGWGLWGGGTGPKGPSAIDQFSGLAAAGSGLLGGPLPAAQLGALTQRPGARVPSPLQIPPPPAVKVPAPDLSALDAANAVMAPVKGWERLFGGGQAASLHPGAIDQFAAVVAQGGGLLGPVAPPAREGRPVPKPGMGILTPAPVEVHAKVSVDTAAVNRALAHLEQTPAAGGAKLRIPVTVDTSAVKRSLAQIEQTPAAGGAKLKLPDPPPVKVPAPDLSQVQAAVGKASSAMAGVVSAMRSAAGPASGAGSAVSAGFAAGIAAGGPAAVAAASALAGQVASALRVSLQVHSPSKVTQAIGASAVQGLIVGLEGGQSALDAAVAAIGKSVARPADIAQIQKTYATLMDDMAKALAGGKITKAEDSAITKLLTKDNQKLQQLAAQRTQLESEIASAEQVSQAAVSSASIMNAQTAAGMGTPEPVGAQELITGQQNQLKQQQQFTSEVQKLQKEGLNATSLSQIVQSGAAAGLPVAQGIDQGGQSAIAELNALQKQIQQSAAQLGNTAGPVIYQSGKDLGAGLASGLKSQLSKVNSEMKSIAAGMVNAVKAAMSGDAKGALQAAGAAIGQALAAGIASQTGAVAAAVAQLIAAAEAAAKGAGSDTSSKGPAKSGAGHPGAGAAQQRAGTQPAYSGTGKGTGGTVHHTEVHVHVGGNVTSEGDLFRSAQTFFLNQAVNNLGTGLKLKGRAA